MNLDSSSTVSVPSESVATAESSAACRAPPTPPTFRIRAEFRDLIPPLAPEELAALEASLVAEGGARDALIIWAERRVLVDGHHRHEICTRLGLPYTVKEMSFRSKEAAADWIDANQLGRRNLTPDQRTLLLGRRYNRAKKAQGGTGANQHSQKGKLCPSAQTADGIAKRHGVSPRTVKNAGRFAKAVDRLKAVVDPGLEKRVVAGAAPPARSVVKAAELLERSPLKAKALLNGELTFREAKREEKIETIKARSEKAEAQTPTGLVRDLASGAGKFSCVYLDPPWRYADTSSRGAAEHHYPTMSVEDIEALPVGALLPSEGGHVWMWTTWPMIRDRVPHRVLEAWGLEWSGEITWDKEIIGAGHYIRSQTEVLILATRNKLPLLHADQGGIVRVKRSRKHSEKPQEFRALVERLSPGPRIELFSRVAVEGWSRWGLEA